MALKPVQGAKPNPVVVVPNPLPATPFNIMAITGAQLQAPPPTQASHAQAVAQRSRGDFAGTPYFPRLHSNHEAMVWAAMVLPYAYSQASLDELKELIGATSITPIAYDADALAPPGLRIDYPTCTVFVIAGTTHQEQWNLFQTQTKYGSTTAVILDNNYALNCEDNSYSLADDRATKGVGGYSGQFFEPFVKMAAPWVVRINNYVAATKTHGTNPSKFYLIGHSLGAAVVHVLCNLMSQLFQRHIASILNVDNSYKLAWNGADFNSQFAGGYCLGCPKVMGYNYVWKDANGENMEDIPSTQLAPPAFSELRKVTCFDQPADPIAHLPLQTNWITRGSWLAGQVDFPIAKFFQFWTDYNLVGFGDTGEDSRVTALMNTRIPPSRETVMAISRRRHSVASYLKRMASSMKVVKAEPGGPWRDLLGASAFQIIGDAEFMK